ncbi:MAG: HDIG domain-containing protein [Bacteroidota bacterium]|nr:HDIG domain-containing protein [Bacteroidota bacterium]
MDFPSENIKDRLIKFFSIENLRHNFVIKIVLGLFLILFAVIMFPHAEMVEYSYNVGSVWMEKDLIAPFSFPIYKELHQYEHQKREAVRLVSPVFERDEKIIKKSIDSLTNVLESLVSVIEARNRWMKTRAPSDSINYKQKVHSFPFPIDEAAFDKPFLLLGEKKSPVLVYRWFEQILVPLIREIIRAGIVDQPKVRHLHSHIAVRSGIMEELIPYDKIYDQQQAINALTVQAGSLFGETVEAEIVQKIVHTVLQPNLIYNQTETNKAIQIAIENVPRTIGYVQANELIISKYERITEELKLKLDSFRRIKSEQGAGYSGWKHWVGTILHVAIIIILFGLYLFLFRKEIFNENGRLLLVAVLILMQLFFTYVSLLINIQLPLQYLILVPAASMLLAIIFDSRVAFFGTIAIALLIAGMRGNDYSLALSSIMAGTLGAYTVRDVRSRTQIFRSLVFIFLGYLVSIIALSLEELDSIQVILTKITFALANAVFSPVLTYALLIFFERFFKVTTDLTYVELADFNHPLLMELSEKAPGTFHHSLAIGNLAESAADAIGANTILARVGGYYHDIGKILKPEYFVENQVGPHNRHTRLKPRMSALIISSHVREGMELGRERGIPETVIDFIPQHHGTTRISFFYDKALKQAAKKPPKDVIQEDDFLYPGPKPQTKETGIVMLADSVEAIVRTLPNLTPQKLESIIENLIKHRFMEGQLDECELTLRDLTKIKEAFLKILMGIHHQRIQYPGQEIKVSDSLENKVEEIVSATQSGVEMPAEMKESESAAPPLMTENLTASEHLSNKTSGERKENVSN